MVNLDTTDGRSLQISVFPEQSIQEVVSKAVECRRGDILHVQLGDHTVVGGLDGESFADYAIADGARLGVSSRFNGGFVEIVEGTLELNRDEFRRERLVINGWVGGLGRTGDRGTPVPVDPHDPLHILGDLDWSELGNSKPGREGGLQIAEAFSMLTIDGNLDLGYNKLTAELFPHTFSDITVHGDLILQGNWTLGPELPSSLSTLQVGGDLSLARCCLRSIPPSIGHFKPVLKCHFKADFC